MMSVAAALSAFGSLNGSFFSGGRVCYVAAREGHMVRKIALVWQLITENLWESNQ